MRNLSMSTVSWFGKRCTQIWEHWMTHALYFTAGGFQICIPDILRLCKYTWHHWQAKDDILRLQRGTAAVPRMRCLFAQTISKCDLRDQISMSWWRLPLLISGGFLFLFPIYVRITASGEASTPFIQIPTGCDIKSSWISISTEDRFHSGSHFGVSPTLLHSLIGQIFHQ